jgi:adenosylcobinamide-phosphate synthase
MPAWQLLTACLADLAFGDPHWMPHPVRFFGVFIAHGETICRKIARSDRALLYSGALLVLVLTSGVALGTWQILKKLTRVSPAAGAVLVLYLAYSTLSIRGLDLAGKEVIVELRRHNTQRARSLLAMIVGRDTGALEEQEIVRAVIETVSENCCDGVVAPLFYLSLGGVPAALAYKAINTLDSMIGYKNERYLYFGRFAARLDDAANFVPARLTAVLVAFAACVLRLRWRDSLRIVRRDAHLQPSPNSGYPEAAFAGALGIQLGGLNFYGGRPALKAPLGDLRKELSIDLYPQVRRLFYAASAAMLALSLAAAACLGRFP